MRPLARVGAAVRAAIGIGTTTAPATDGVIGSTQIRLAASEAKDSVPHVQLYGFASAVPVGTGVVVLFPNGDRANGLVIGSNHPAYRPQGMKSGESQVHDDLGQQVYLRADGMIVIKPVVGVLIEGPVTVTGDVVANGVSLRMHVHPSGSPDTGPPQG